MCYGGFGLGGVSGRASYFIAEEATEDCKVSSCGAVPHRIRVERGIDFIPRQDVFFAEKMCP